MVMFISTEMVSSPIDIDKRTVSVIELMADFRIQIGEIVVIVFQFLDKRSE